MIYPVPLFRGRAPTISSGFGESRDEGSRSHLGVDIAYRAIDGDPPYPGHYTTNRTPNYYMPNGIPALAVFDGEVSGISQGSYGLAVRLRHLSGSSQYVHLEKALVREGQRVRAGTPVGIIGASPPPRGPFKHLHFDWISGGAQVDPAPILSTLRKIPLTAVAAGGGLLLLGILGAAGYWYYRKR